VTIDVISWGARSYDQPIVSLRMDFQVPALGSKVVKTVALKPHLRNESLTLLDAVVRLKVTATGNPRGEQTRHTRRHILYVLLLCGNLGFCKDPISQGTLP